MAEENKGYRQDALLMVYLRNSFYQKKYYYALGVLLLCLISIVILIVMLLQVARKPTKPLYFLTDKAGRLILDVPLTVPNLSTDQVTAWTIRAVQAAYSYDFVNYRTQLQDAQKYFTDYGWRSYMKGLTDSNNLVALNQRKLVITAQIVDNPKLLVQGVLGGAFAWKFQMPVLVTYYSPPYDEKSKFQNALLLNVIVQRQKLLTSYQGLGIVQMIGTFAGAPEQQSLAPTI